MHELLPEVPLTADNGGRGQRISGSAGIFRIMAPNSLVGDMRTGQDKNLGLWLTGSCMPLDHHH